MRQFMQTISDNHNVALDKNFIDNIYYELNNELRKKFRNCPSEYKADLYVVGSACIVSCLHSRNSTTDIDAMWNIGSTMRDCINIVGDRLGLGHTYINCNFKQTKSYTDAILTNSSVYKQFDRLTIRTVNLDLLLCMKLISFRDNKQTDIDDCISIINVLKNRGYNVNTEFIVSLLIKYYKRYDMLSVNAKRFIGLGD
jgi:hypothetical protein